MEIVDKDFARRLDAVIKNVKERAAFDMPEDRAAFDSLANLIKVMGESDSLSIKQLIALNEVMDEWDN